MEHSAILITLGLLLLAGLALDALGARTRLPRVTLLVLFGILVGSSGLDLIPRETADEWYPLIAKFALVMVAFLLGGRLTRSVIEEQGRPILGVSIGAVVITCLTVGIGLWVFGADPLLCLIFAGISVATAPAATQDVIRASKVNLPFTRILSGVVAIDDAWALIVFSLLLAAGHAWLGNEATGPVQHIATEIGGAVIIGFGIGLPAAYLTGRLEPGEPSLTEALGIVFLCGGVALATGASFLLSTMICGAVIANMARHHARPFHEIESVEWPFMVVFFILAGASLEFAAVVEIGLVGVAYVLLRIIGRVLGGWIGGRAGGMGRLESRWIGLALMPQAGVAMGMALVAADAFPDQARSILAIAIGTTVIFELIGPLFTQIAISKAVAKEKAR
jgi:Kef-type K+ transport system membrane component KefB